MRKLPMSWAASRFNSEMKLKLLSWTAIKKELSTPKVSRESYKEYLSYDKEKQLQLKDVGYFIVGEFNGNIRHNADFKRRATITLDIDNPGADFKRRLARSFKGYELFWHTSRKSCPELPRIRVVLPMSRDITTADQAEALTRKLAEWYGIEAVDRVSYVPAQMMFFPSRCKDGVFETGEQHGEWLDPIETLDREYMDYTDRHEWPRTAGEVPPETRVDKVDSPLSKPGVIGAFCRAYSITRCIEDVIPGIYEPTEVEGRYRYHEAEGGGGAIIYDDDTALYSNHTNHDPAGGRSTNAFDLARIHKFGPLDQEAEFEDLTPTQMPSFVAMQAFAMTLPDVVEELDVVGRFDDVREGDSTAGVETVHAVARREAASMPAEESVDIVDDLDDPTPPAVKRKPGDVARDRVRFLIDDCEDPDMLADTAIPAIAGAGLTAVVESTLLKLLQSKYQELTGDKLDMRAIAASVKEVKRKLVAATPVISEDDELPSDVLRNEDTGLPLSTMVNMRTWLAEGRSGYDFRFDEFMADEMMAPCGTNEWRSVSKTDVNNIRAELERAGFASFGGGNEVIRMAIDTLSKDNRFDSAQFWLADQMWDGTPRIETFFIDHFGVVDSPYARAVGRYWWSALAGRIVRPGIKADMMPILVGPQGLRKSSSVAAMAPAMDFFAEFAFKANDDNQGRKMVGKLVAEIGELRGLASADEQTVKTFLSSPQDSWRQLYNEKQSTLKRRLMFCGTTDVDEFLSDIAGNRRFLPLTVTRADPDAIHSLVDQLYAEGLEWFQALGQVDHSAEKLAADAHSHHTISDVWDSSIAEWLALPKGEFDNVESSGDEDDGLQVTNGSGVVTVSDVLQHAIRKDMAHASRADEMRAAKILKRMGYVKFDGWLKGVGKVKGWHRLEPGKLPS